MKWMPRRISHSKAQMKCQRQDADLLYQGRPKMAPSEGNQAFLDHVSCQSHQVDLSSFIMSNRGWTTFCYPLTHNLAAKRQASQWPRWMMKHCQTSKGSQVAFPFMINNGEKKMSMLPCFQKSAFFKLSLPSYSKRTCLNANVLYSRSKLCLLSYSESLLQFCCSLVWALQLFFAVLLFASSPKSTVLPFYFFTNQVKSRLTASLWLHLFNSQRKCNSCLQINSLIHRKLNKSLDSKFFNSLILQHDLNQFYQK